MFNHKWVANYRGNKMTTIQIANQLRAIKGISLSALEIGLMISAVVFAVFYIAYVLDIPHMIAATLAAYIGIIA